MCLVFIYLFFLNSREGSAATATTTTTDEHAAERNNAACAASEVRRVADAAAEPAAKGRRQRRGPQEADAVWAVADSERADTRHETGALPGGGGPLSEGWCAGKTAAGEFDEREFRCLFFFLSFS